MPRATSVEGNAVASGWWGAESRDGPEMLEQRVGCRQPFFLFNKHVASGSAEGRG